MATTIKLMMKATNEGQTSRNASPRVSAAGEVGDLELQHEQRDDDSEDAVTECQHSRRIVLALVDQKSSIIIHIPTLSPMRLLLTRGRHLPTHSSGRR